MLVFGSRNGLSKLSVYTNVVQFLGTPVIVEDGCHNDASKVTES